MLEKNFCIDYLTGMSRSFTGEKIQVKQTGSESIREGYLIVMQFNEDYCDMGECVPYMFGLMLHGQVSVTFTVRDMEGFDKESRCIVLKEQYNADLDVWERKW